MKLKNKKTGEIAEASVLNFELVVRYDDGRVEKYPLLFDYSNFEDYEEPKEYWYIDDAGVIQIDQVLSSEINMRKSIGNYFLSREEAEKAVEKLKAWKRLKEKGFRYDSWHSRLKKGLTFYAYYDEGGIGKDLETVFGSCDGKH